MGHDLGKGMWGWRLAGLATARVAADEGATIAGMGMGVGAGAAPTHVVGGTVRPTSRREQIEEGLGC